MDRSTKQPGFWITPGDIDGKGTSWKRFVPNPDNIKFEFARRWRHKKRGSTYTEVGRAELQVAGIGAQLVDGQTLVVYRGDDGKLWVREETEFMDGRFEEINNGPE